MSETPPNGLAALTAQRDRARRSMPPPRHPVITAQRVESTEVPVERERPVANAAPTTADDDGAAQDAAWVPSAGPGAAGPATIKVTLYVDRSADDFMEAARIAGLSARPKVDVSRSAVVRLALRELMKEMSPTEVKALLESQPVRAGGPGRKRR
jgi:hypothetical protein